MADAARESAVADAIGMYLESVATHDLLTAEDEVRLARAIERGQARRRGTRLPRPDIDHRAPGRTRPVHPPGRSCRQAAVHPVATCDWSSPSPSDTRARPRPARPDPGGQPRPHPRRREVRLAQGLQVLDLCDVVDSPGHHARARQPRPHHPAPGAHGRCREDRARGRALPPRAAAADADDRRDRRGERSRRGQDPDRPQRTWRHGVAGSTSR